MKHRVALFMLLLTAVTANLGCSKRDDPSDARIRHTQAMIEIIKNNKNDCNQIVSELQAYNLQHGAEMKVIGQKGDALLKAMKEPERKQYEEKMLKKFAPVFQDALALITEIGQKCPEQIQKINEAWREFN